MGNVVLVLLALVGVAGIVWGAETFAEHVAEAAAGLGVSTFALALLLAGAEPEELATVVTASVRDAPGIAFGDVVGANIAICLVAVGAGAWVAPLHFARRARRYLAGGLVLGGVAVAIAWDGEAGRAEGALLVALYGAFVLVLWRVERSVPALGEVAELESAGAERTERVTPAHRGRALLLAVLGVAGMVAGALVLVESVRRLADVEETEMLLGVTLVGFATAFELTVLAVSAARRGTIEAALGGIVGSFAYNATMTLGAGALVRPLTITDAGLLHAPLVAMVGAPALLLALTAVRRGAALRRGDAAFLFAVYAGFVVVLSTR